MLDQATKRSSSIITAVAEGVPTFSFNYGSKLVIREAGHTLKAGKSLHTPTVLLAALFFELE